MKKKNKIFKYIFLMFLFSFSVIYFSELTGYYEYQNHQKAVMTEEQIRKFEDDVSNGKEVDIKDYIDIEQTTFDNKFTKLTSKFSDGISYIVQGGVNQTFKFLAKMMEE